MPFVKTDRCSRAGVLAQALTATAALMLSGCGGGSSSPPTQSQGRAPRQHTAVLAATQQRRDTHGQDSTHHPVRRRQPNASPAHSSTQSHPRAGASQPRPHHPQSVQHQQQPHTQQPAHNSVATTHSAHQPAPRADATATFKQSYQPAVASLTQSSQAIGSALRQAPSQTRAQIISTFRGLAVTWQSQLSRLVTLKPPTSVAADFSALAGVGKRIDADLHAIVAATVSKNASAGKQAVVSIVTDLIAARSADTRLEQKLATA